MASIRFPPYIFKLMIMNFSIIILGQLIKLILQRIHIPVSFWFVPITNLQRQRIRRLSLTWPGSVPVTVRSWMDLRLGCPLPFKKNQKIKILKSIPRQEGFNSYSKKLEFVAPWIYTECEKNKCLLLKKEKERCKERKRNSYSILTQKLLAYNEVCPNTITTPTTQELLNSLPPSSVMCLNRWTLGGWGWWRHLFQGPYVSFFSKTASKLRAMTGFDQQQYLVRFRA